LAEGELTVKIRFFDLETTDLKGLMGRILCASFTDWDTDEVVTFRLDDKPWKGRSKIDDGKLALAIRDYLEEANMVVAHNGRLFDIPFLNARLAKVGERPLRTQFVMDPRWYLNSGAMRIGSAKLVNAEKFFGLSDKTGGGKTEISWGDWALAATGDRTAMDEVVYHCEQDVKVLKELYPHVLPYVSTLHR
jgi:uncharacterized protein YprB with RNaseH-like and TPR domain